MRTGERCGALRALDPQDVLMLIGGITLVASREDQPGLAPRLLELAIEGFRPSAGAGG